MHNGMRFDRSIHRMADSSQDLASVGISSVITGRFMQNSYMHELTI